MSEILRAVFGSGGDTIVPAVHISSEGQEDINLTVGYKNIVAKNEDGEDITYVAAGINIGLDGTSNDGNQSVAFGIDNVSGEAQEFAWTAIMNGAPVNIKLYTYLESDLSGPSENPLTLQAVGGTITAGSVVFQGAYLDLLNIQFPRRIYETSTFPAIQFISRSSDL